jgi:hypothetical protein
MLHAVADLNLPDAWLAAGVVRNAVWDALHGFEAPTALNDVDVVWFDPARASPEEDQRLEDALRRRAPGIPWSVRNQARMHRRHGHTPYRDCLDAMRFWPETATAVRGRVGAGGKVEIGSAWGLEDLVNLIIRPTPYCPPSVFRQRVASKGWLDHWPRLRLEEA